MNYSFMNALDINRGGNVIVMVGPPHSGKSTIAKDISSKFDNFTIISPDNIRKELTGDASDQSKNIKVFEDVYTLFKIYLSGNMNIIYDATNCRSSYRKKIIDFCRDLPKTEKIIALVSTVPFSLCLERNNDCERVIPENVIENMYFTLKKHPPTIFEGFDMIVGFN